MRRKVARVSASASFLRWDLRFYDPTVYTPVAQIQLDIQYIFNPGSRDRQPERSHTEDQERTVIGLDTNITF